MIESLSAVFLLRKVIVMKTCIRPSRGNQEPALRESKVLHSSLPSVKRFFSCHDTPLIKKRKSVADGSFYTDRISTVHLPADCKLRTGQ